MNDKTRSAPMRFDDPQDDIGSNPNPVRPIGEIIAARLTSRPRRSESTAIV